MKTDRSSLRILVIGLGAEAKAIGATELEKIGYTCTFVPSAMVALKMLDSKSFDLVLLHVNLPDGAGLQLCNEIRQLYGTSMVIILLDDQQKASAAVTALKLGADDCASLSCDIQELTLRMTAYTRRHAGAGSLKPPTGCEAEHAVRNPYERYSLCWSESKALVERGWLRSF